MFSTFSLWRQRLLCTSAANAEEPVACNESVAVACEESVAEPNQRLPKPFCRGIFARCAFALCPKLGICSPRIAAAAASLAFTFEQSGLRALDCERFAPYGYASCGPCTRLKYNIKLWKKVQLPIHAPTDLFHVKYA